jgi:predicted DNA-binding transcriptional regulator YafY
MKVNTLKRKIQLLDRLRSGIGCTIDHLAQEMAVSRRTVFRDLEALGKAGYRFDVKNSQYRMAPHFGHTAPKLESKELLAILFAAHVSPLMADSKLSIDVRQAMRKLLEKAKPAERTEIVDLLAVCTVQGSVLTSDDSASPPLGGPDVLITLLQALAGKSVVHMTFDDGSSTSAVETVLAPLRLTIADDRWTVEGYSSLHQRHHSFILSHIAHAAIEPANNRKDTSGETE